MLFDKKCIFFFFKNRISFKKEMVKKDRLYLAFFVPFCRGKLTYIFAYESESSFQEFLKLKISEELVSFQK